MKTAKLYDKTAPLVHRVLTGETFGDLLDQLAKSYGWKHLGINTHPYTDTIIVVILSNTHLSWELS